MGSVVSSTSSSSGQSGGGDYTGKLYFDPEADTAKGPSYTIEDSELREKVRELVDSSDPILEVTILRHPLNDWQLTDLYMYHAFVIIETEKWWWSVEKNSEGVTLQRSKKKPSVEDEYRRNRRLTPITWVRKAPGRGSIIDLVDFIYRENLLANNYNFLVENCKKFAAAVFNEVSEEGTRECTVGVGFRIISDLP